jgi:class 3 adenylate cyclase
VILLTYEPERAAPTSKFVEDYSWTAEQVRSLQAAQNVDRVLATVLLTDIVDSTTRAAQIGDRSWRKLIDRHDEAARAEVALWLGQVVKCTGDGILATFDAPTRALRCAFGLREACTRLGLEMRAAVHTGEIERRGADIGGIGVHITARTIEESGSGQVVVTNTVRELATGTDLTFTSRGSVNLRGVPGQWQLFEAALESV